MPAGDPPDPAVYAGRAMRAHRAMQGSFRRGDGKYRRDGFPRRPGAVAHLWPFARALVATLDVAGIRPGLTTGFDAAEAIATHLEALERYRVADADPAPYASDVVGPRARSDRYYDDNAWVGLALIELERIRPGSGWLGRAGELFRFATGGWDERRDVPAPGGVFWVQQGLLLGRRNHDRNTVSSAPNAQLGLHLAELTGQPPGPSGSIGAVDMYEWVNTSLGADPDAPATGLFWDKIRGDGTVDRTLWSYNQGSMIGANVLLARGAPPAARHPYRARAETIARGALRHYAGIYERQPPAFNAIFFRNLLLLHDATRDADLQHEIIGTMRAYADAAWADRRDRHDRFRFSRGQATLLDQSAIVQVLALLAWDAGAYGRVA
jgi:hypothetical protein